MSTEYVQFHGDPTTQTCVDAIARLIQQRDRITEARLLTAENEHAFLLKVGEIERIFVKSGFTSGYSGEGPRGLASVLQLLRRHQIDVEEVVVPSSMIARINSNAATSDDFDRLESARPVRPWRIGELTFGYRENLNHLFAAALPFRILDERIFDLALKLEVDHDAALMQGFRKFEQLVATRSGLLELRGAALLSKAFTGRSSPLTWPDIHEQEADARGQFIAQAFRAYRNPRAHGEQPASVERTLREFLILNELFLLEKQSVARDASPDQASSSTS